MSPTIALGTHRCRDIPVAAAVAAAAGVDWIDTAPNYAAGNAQQLLAPVLSTHSGIAVSTKVGFFDEVTGRAAVAAGAMTPEQAAAGHCLAPDYVAWQIRRNLRQLRRDRIDVLFLHNPEHVAADRASHRATFAAAFTALEKAAADGLIGGYGVAGWSGFTDGTFTVAELVAVAEQVSADPHLAAVQLPVSLVMLQAVEQALDGLGPLAEAQTAGLDVFASAPLHGGELPAMLTGNLADFIRPGASPVEAGLAVAASAPGVRRVLVSVSSARHWMQAADAVTGPALDEDTLRKVTDVLR